PLPAARMRIACASLWLCLVVSAVQAQSSPDALTDQIHWSFTGPTSVTVVWRGLASLVTYGTERDNLPFAVFATPSTPLPDGAGPFREARIIGLESGTHYYYRVGAGDVHEFETPLPRGSSGFWFAQEADVGSSRTYPQVLTTQQQIAADEAAVPGDDRPEFVLLNGDLTYGDQGNVADVDQHFNDVMVWSEDAAYLPAWGNHDWDPAGSLKGDQVNNYKGRVQFPNPRRSPGTGTACVANDTVPGEDWYWFDYGNVRFIALPPASEGACGYAGARVAWRAAADSLMDQVDGDPLIRFVVTYGHFPPYSSGADHSGDAAIASDLGTLRSQHPKYVLHLSAHSHHYERFDPAQTGGLLHVLSGGGGSVLGGLASAPLPATVVRYGHTHHLKIRVSADRIEGYAVCGPERPEESSSCVPGALIDQWAIVSAITTDVPPTAMPPAVRAGWYDVLGRRVQPGTPGAYFRPGKPRLIVR
ncbi:MAG: metallophosphoesterase family protein, partial [Candidatus Eisenbacteria bacterium]